MSVPPLKEMMDLLVAVQDGAIELVQRLTLNLGSARNRTMLSLYATILEQTDSAVLLLASGKPFAVDIILRSSLEAFVDLLNLANTESYLECLSYLYHDEQGKLLRSGIEGKNKFLMTLHNDPDTAAALKEHERIVGELKEKKVPLLKIFDKFQRADLSQEYRSFYKELCNEAHNNLSVLINRHIIHENDVLNVAIFQKRTPYGLAFTIDALTSIILDSSTIMYGYFESPEAETIEKWKMKRKAIAQAHEVAEANLLDEIEKTED
jgi:hypothetical protein